MIFNGENGLSVMEQNTGYQTSNCTGRCEMTAILGRDMTEESCTSWSTYWNRYQVWSATMTNGDNAYCQPGVNRSGTVILYLFSKQIILVKGILFTF